MKATETHVVGTHQILLCDITKFWSFTNYGNDRKPVNCLRSQVLNQQLESTQTCAHLKTQKFIYTTQNKTRNAINIFLVCMCVCVCVCMQLFIDVNILCQQATPGHSETKIVLLSVRNFFDENKKYHQHDDT